MAGPGDALFLALAQAKAQPSRALRAVNAGAQAGNNILGGYMEGQDIRQKLDQYRLLNTPLGSMYSDPSQIPFGLSPTHSVRDLMTLAPAMENYVPSNLISGAARSFGANVSDGSGGAPPPQSPPPNPAPLGGTNNPAPPPGTTDLASIQGTGAGAQDNIPPGTPPAVVSPTINVPAGGMGMKGFQNVVLPALKAGQEGRQFQEGQNNENTRAALSRQLTQQGQNAEESRFKREHMASAAEKVGASMPTLTGLNQFVNELQPLVSNNHPIPFVGSAGGDVARASGGFGTPQMVNSMKIDDTAGKASALLDKQLAGRFNEQEANLLKKVMVPSGKDQGGYDAKGIANYGQDKLNKLKAFSNALNSGNEQIIRNMASAMTGGAIDVVPPSGIQNSGQPPSNTYASEAQVPPNLPKGTIITVNGRRAVIR
jgi:hypothetical protein